MVPAPYDVHAREMLRAKTAWAVVFVAACTASAKQQGMEKLLGTMSPQERSDNFQEAANVLADKIRKQLSFNVRPRRRKRGK